MDIVKQLERPVREPKAHSRDDSETGMSPEIRALILSFGGTDQASGDDSERSLHGVKPETPGSE